MDSKILKLKPKIGKIYYQVVILVTCEIFTGPVSVSLWDGGKKRGKQSERVNERGTLCFPGH